MVVVIGAHWSSLELENMKIDKADLIQVERTIGAHWSPLELEIDAELIRVVLNLTSLIPNYTVLLKSIGVI